MGKVPQLEINFRSGQSHLQDFPNMLLSNKSLTCNARCKGVILMRFQNINDKMVRESTKCGLRRDEE